MSCKDDVSERGMLHVKEGTSAAPEGAIKYVHQKRACDYEVKQTFGNTPYRIILQEKLAFLTDASPDETWQLSGL